MSTTEWSLSRVAGGFPYNVAVLVFSLTYLPLSGCSSTQLKNTTAPDVAGGLKVTQAEFGDR